MRRADHLLKTMSAVRRCIEQCRYNASPLATLDKCLHELRQDSAWTKEEIAEVETAARRVIQSDSFCRVPIVDTKATTLVEIHG